MTILESIPFGNHYVGLRILRNSLLTSCMLSNSEAWYNITKAELSLLETVDVMLLRKILNAPCTMYKFWESQWWRISRIWH